MQLRLELQGKEKVSSYKIGLVRKKLSLNCCISGCRSSGGKFSDIQWTCDVIEKVMRQLEAQGGSIEEQQTLIQQIISKFPMEVIVKLEESKHPIRPCILREAIRHYITVNKNVFLTVVIT